MEQVHDYDKTCERYLLGELSEQEQTQLEEAYFADDALFERFRAVKDDLVDAYARGDLTGQKRERFEQHFLATNPRQQRVEEAKGFIRVITGHGTTMAALNTTTSVHTTPSSSWWQSISERFASRPSVWQGGLTALLLIALAGSWVLFKRFQDQRATVVPPINENRSDLAGNKPTNLNGSEPPVHSTTPTTDRSPQPKTADRQSPQPVPAQVASLFLSPFSPRDATASNSLMLQPDTSAVRLHLAFKGDNYRRYDVVLRTLDGEQVLSRHGLKASSGATVKSVTLPLDPSVFRRQDYIVTLSGLTTGGKLEAIGDYYFRVERSSPQSKPTP